MNSKELREKFIQFFVAQNHQLLPPSTLISDEDPSVLFTTAGMQQFKKYYLQPEEAPASDVVTCQPCFRTSDIEEVGDETHLTFFEMLGNFSFGGYYKKETIKWGYEFLTKELNIQPEQISCTIFGGDKINPRDNESADVLKSMNLKYKESSCEDNFWGPTGEEGPCGPTVEFYVSNIEVWNLVFNECYKDRKGSYRPLETKGVDTGLGLERMVAVTNNQKDIFKTDVFLPLINKIEEISQKKYQDFSKEFRVIADHIKAAVFAINDNILPGNKDRGYIVRRLIRRAIVKGSRLGIKENFLSSLADEVFKIYDGVYQFDQKLIKNELQKEEEKFRQTLKQGLKIIQSKTELSGQDLFNLFQSFGIPMEIAIEEAKNQSAQVNNEAIKQFEQLSKAHQDLSRTASAGMFKGGLAGGGEMETKYHTATHLLLASLRDILGKNTYQKGANITAERIRFDFNYRDKLADEQIQEIEDWVNDKIKRNLPVEMKEMMLGEALKSGATAILGFKYPDKVKVYSIGQVSCEICGGPHVKSTGILGHFKIIKEESSSAGVRRIKAILK